MRIKLFLLIFVLACTSASYSQVGRSKNYKKSSSNFTSSRKFWKSYRQEIALGIGVSNFLGDLGGLNRIGTDYSIVDLEFALTRPDLSATYRYRLARRWAVKGGLYYGVMRGDDKLTKEPFRQNRNLHFKSNIYELSGQLEFSFLVREQVGHRYSIKGARGFKNLDVTGYVFLGIGGFYFNPKAQYSGKWYELQPLGTEGQGIKPGTKKYSRISGAIPMGAGFKHNINRYWSINIEAGLRKTFTDYIDDASTTYYNNDIILQERGTAAAYLADPNLGNFPYQFDTTGRTADGQQRADSKQNDSYMFVILSIAKKFTRINRTRSKF